LAGPIKRASRRTEYFPVLFATDPSMESSLIGMDLHTEAVRRGVIMRAIASDRMAAAQNVMLRGARGLEKRGVFIALPVYRHGAPHDAGENSRKRRAHLLGILGGAFQTEELIDAILAGARLPQSVDLYLFAANANDNALPVYARKVVSGHTRTEVTLVKSEVQATPHWSTSLIVGDARWELFVAPSAGGLISHYRAWLLLILIVLLFAAVLAYMWASLRHALRLEAANRKVLQLAQTDTLTTLANRRAFMKRLKLAFSASQRNAQPFAVLYLDI
jgi:CHASE1-domain containing sensor protein